MITLKIRLQPKQKLFRESIDKNLFTLFGGARGGGKSYALRNIFLTRAFEFPKSSSVIFRKTYPELESNHIRPLFQEHPELRQYYNESKKILALPNSSTLQFSHCENDKDVALQQGREIQNLGIDEVGQWPEKTFRTLLGSNRSGNPNIPARCALTANPGGIGHAWLKRLFIEKRFNDRERPQDYHFIQSLVSDNPALIESDPDYVHRLNSETNEALRKAYLYGDWDLQAGQFFQEISRQVHFIRPFSIPGHWNKFGSYDFGFNHPAAFGWFAIDEDGNVYLYREFIRAQLRVDLFAKEILRHNDTLNLYPIIGGLDCWTQKSVLREEAKPPTVAEQFAEVGIHLKKAVVDRIQGAQQVRNYLAWQGKPNNKPRFYIFDTCPISFDTLSRMIFDPDHPEDVLKIDATEGDPLSGDDAYDMIRYGLMSRPMITDAMANKPPKYSAQWYQQQSNPENMWEQEREYLEKQQNDGNWPSNGDWPED